MSNRDEITIYLTEIRDGRLGPIGFEAEAIFIIEDDGYIYMKLDGKKYRIKRRSIDFLKAFTNCYSNEDSIGN